MKPPTTVRESRVSLARSIRRLALAAAAGTAALAAPACRADPAAPALTAGSAEAYVGRWIVADPGQAPLPLGLRIARAGDGVTAWVTYSGVAYEATGTVGPRGLLLQRPEPALDAVTYLHGTLRRDGLLAVRLDIVGARINSAPQELVLRRE